MRRLPLRSPPRVWGKVDHTIAGRIRVGITPACAGKRAASAREAYFIWDHPRVCGEKETKDTKKDLKLGSPPRMREKVAMQRTSASASGSPPRMRGKVGVRFIQPVCHGITPAYAGKRPLTVCWRWQKRDHPRVCGEKTFDRLLEMAEKGSPPRMRGKVRAAKIRIRNVGSPLRVRGKDLTFTVRISAERITPAYAGKS